MSIHCIACTSPARVERTLFDDRYGYPGEFELHRCGSCGHRSLHAPMTPPQISDLYTQYYPRSTFDVESWSPPGEETPLRIWWNGLKASAFRWVPRNVRVLDIGCGFGESLGYHRVRGCEAHGVEADRNILRVAERYELTVQVGLFDPANYTTESFDVVTLDQVIEHVTDPVSVLQGVRHVLKPGGMIVVSTPNADGWGARLFGNRWIHWHAPYHLQFFTRRSMSLAASRAGLELEGATTVTNSAWLDFQWGHIATYPTAGEPSPYWNAARERSLGQRVALKLFRIIDLAGVNKLVSRLMDSIGVGDNIVYILRKPAS